MACGGCNESRSVGIQPTLFLLATHGGPVHERLTCSKCTFKHLAYAYVALTEVEHGYPEHIELAHSVFAAEQLPKDITRESLRDNLDQKARAVGHLVHAMEECPDLRLADDIRKAYTAILDEEETPDILALLEILNVD